MGQHGAVRPTTDEFRVAWPRIVRTLAAWSGSLDDAEDYAAEAVARALARDDIDDLAAWCVQVAKRAWIDDHRRRDSLARLAPELAPEEATAAVEPEDLPGALDDRLALLFVACDEELAPGAQMVLALRVVCGLSIAESAMHLGIRDSAAAARLTRAKKALAQARGEFRVPEAAERLARLPVVLDCVAGMFTVAHRTVLDPSDPLVDLGRQALSIADALVADFPDDTEVRGLRAVIRLGLARRPGRVDDDGVALTLHDMDRSRWDHALLRAGLDDAAFAASGVGRVGRFALESAISGVHSVASSLEETDWPRLVQLYAALEQVWSSPAVRVARLTATAQLALSRGADLTGIEAELTTLTTQGPAYARRDAAFALADLCWHTGRKDAAGARYRVLAEESTSEAVRRFCTRRIAGT
jgi:RNA polymerase sigma-70 factor (ECF subfamily)